MTHYDCAHEVLHHKERVRELMAYLVGQLTARAEAHDDSKLLTPEREAFNRWHPVLQTVTFGTPEYREALAAMGPGLQHHYQANRHHPEHHAAGIAGMTLIDLVEMIIDWMAVAGAKGSPVNLDYLVERFGIEPQLAAILKNTFQESTCG